MSASWFRNYYEHKDCPVQPGIEWADHWEAICSNRCPACRTEVEPHDSTNLSEDHPDAEIH